MSSVTDVEIADAISPDSTLMFAIVNILNEDGDIAKEAAEVISVSPTGAGFYVPRDCKPGRLVQILAPVEESMRFYDEDKELYPVWGVVQHCHRVNGEDGFHVGIAFIGKDAPDSFYENPMQSYRICGMNTDGLWKIQEAREFKPRKDARFYAAVDHYLAVVDSKNTDIRGERTVTENISKSGAAVVTTLDLHSGDRVKFISEEFDFSGVAVVCSRRNAKGGKAVLSLQFVGAAFPIERVSSKASAPKEEPVAA